MVLPVTAQKAIATQMRRQSMPAESVVRRNPDEERPQGVNIRYSDRHLIRVA
jgi:ribosomal protein L14